MKICTHIWKLKIKWGNGYELFSIFFVENGLFTENVKKGVRGNEPNGRTFNLHSLYSYQSKRNFVLYKNRESFFNFHLSFGVIHFFQKNEFLLEKLKFRTA